MVGRFHLGCRRKAKGMLAVGQVVLVAGVLTACSSVPDAVNPVEWYKGASDMISGRERPEVASPVPGKPELQNTADQRKDLTKGLVADRGNAQYAEPVRREVTPTRPLARKAPAPSESQVAKAPGAEPVKVAGAPVVPPKPAVQAQPLPEAKPAQVIQSPQLAQAAEPRVSPDRRTPSARAELPPDQPPTQLAMQPPPRADVPETVPMPGKGRPKPLQAQYERRLAESAQQVVRPDLVAMPEPAAQARFGDPTLARIGDDAPIHLVPPTGKRPRSGGGKGMAAPAPVAAPAASFQVASVDFASGANLTAADRAAIAEVARLYRQTGGVVRVVGHAPVPAFASADAVAQMMGGLESSIQRANAVARELSKRGVPAGKIMVGADPAAGQGAGAQVYIDVM